MSTHDPEETARVLADLVPEPSGYLHADLCTAAREVMNRRAINSHNGGVIIAAMRAAGMSWRHIEECSGIHTRSARRWAEPPKRS